MTHSHFEMMKTLISRSYPDVKFQYSMGTVPTPDGTLSTYMRVATDAFTFSVLESSRWTMVQRILRKKMEENNEYVCEICCESSKTQISCNNCSNSTCGECYIRMFQVGQGIITCAYCRDQTGHRMSTSEIMRGAAQIRHRLQTRTSGTH